MSGQLSLKESFAIVNKRRRHSDVDIAFSATSTYVTVVDFFIYSNITIHCIGTGTGTETIILITISIINNRTNNTTDISNTGNDVFFFSIKKLSTLHCR
jgi:hypothetical protein